MREYGQIQCSFWTNPDVQELSDGGKLLAVYLLAGPHSNGLGCYRLPAGYVMADFGWSGERVTQTLSELSRNGFIRHCQTTNFILIPKFLRWNPISNGNVAKARWTEFETISKRTCFYNELCAGILEYGNHLPNPFETLLKGFAKRYTKQDPTLPNPIQPKQTRSSSANTKTENPATDFSDFNPEESTIERIRMRFPDVPDEFIENEKPGFLIYAETNYQRRQLQGKFFSWIVRAWEMKLKNPEGKTNGSRTLSPVEEYEQRVQRENELLSEFDDGSLGEDGETVSPAMG